MDEETKTPQSADAGQENSIQQETEAAKTFTQDEVNTLLAKERRKLERKAAKAQEQPENEPDIPDNSQDTAALRQTEQLNRELLEARAQIEAFKAGVAPEVAEDAVYLAIRETEKSGGEQNEDAIKEALKAVLKRHPEWNTKEKAKIGIKVGVLNNSEDLPNEGPKFDTTLSAKKRWNRFN